MKKIFNKIRSLKRYLTTKRGIAGYVEVERAERIFYLEYLREGMTVFDVGANVGELALIFSRFVGVNGRVHAFEASHNTFKKLEIVCEAAGKSNILLNHLALSDKNDIITLNVYADPYSSFNSQALRPLKNYGLELEPVGKEEVPALTIDKYCEENSVEIIDLLKIDVEGAELQVLQGARKMLESKRIACLTFEFGQTTFDMGNRPEEIEDYLREMNYKIRNIVKGNPVFPGCQSVETAMYAMHVAAP